MINEIATTAKTPIIKVPFAQETKEVDKKVMVSILMTKIERLNGLKDDNYQG